MNVLRKLQLWLFAALVFMIPAVHAGMVNFTFDGAANDVIGTLTFDDATNGISNGTSFARTITGISGIVTGVGGGAITNLIANPNQPNAFADFGRGFIYDNNFFADGGQFLNIFGVRFDTIDGTAWNLWGNRFVDLFRNQSVVYQLFSFDARVNTLGTLTVARIPEPGTMALLGLGLLGIGYVSRKKLPQAGFLAT